MSNVITERLAEVQSAALSLAQPRRRMGARIARRLKDEGLA